MPVTLEDIEGGEKRIAALADLPKGAYVQGAKTRIAPETIASVEMEWAAVTGPDAKYPALGTENLATCMGLAVHNPRTKATGLAHLAQDGATTNLGEESRLSLITMMDRVAQGGGPLEVRMVGPNVRGYLADEFVDNVAEILKEYDVTVLSADFGPKAGMIAFAVHSAMWDQGLVRGRVPLADILHANTNGGKDAVAKLHAECVNLEKMSPPGRSSGHLCYDGLSEAGPAPEPPAVG